MKEANLEGHPCVTDRKDGKLWFRVWKKGKTRHGGQEFTLKLTDNERIKLIHMLSE